MHSFETNYTKIEEIMKRMHVTDFKIANSNGEFWVQVNEDVVVRESDLVDGYFPVEFGLVKGNFYCQSPALISLRGAPDTVRGSFNVNNSGITSLEYGPGTVDDEYMCMNTKITSLEGAPLEVKNFNATKNKLLVSLKGCPVRVSGFIDFTNAGLKSLDGMNSEFISKLWISNTKIKSFEGLHDKLKSCDEISASFEKIQKGGISLMMINNLKKLQGAGNVLPFKIIAKYLGQPEKIFECQNELIEAGFEAFAEP